MSRITIANLTLKILTFIVLLISMISFNEMSSRIRGGNFY